MMILSTSDKAAAGYALAESVHRTNTVFVYSPCDPLKARLLDESVQAARRQASSEEALVAQVLFVLAGSSYTWFLPEHGRGHINLCNELRRLGVAIRFVLCPVGQQAPSTLDRARAAIQEGWGAAAHDVKVWGSFDPSATIPAGCTLVNLSEPLSDHRSELVRGPVHGTAVVAGPSLMPWGAFLTVCLMGILAVVGYKFHRVVVRLAIVEDKAHSLEASNIQLAEQVRNLEQHLVELVSNLTRKVDGNALAVQNSTSMAAIANEGVQNLTSKFDVAMSAFSNLQSIVASSLLYWTS